MLLKVAREARGWTQAELATRSGIRQGSVSKYEKGVTVPSNDQLGLLAGALGYPESFFRNLDARPAAVLYRSRALRSARLEAHVRARLNLGRLVAQRLLEDVTVEGVASFPPPDRELGNPEQAAATLRQAWWVAPGPVESICDLIESAGGVVLRMDLGTDDVVAAYMHPLGDPVRWFFVNTRVQAGDRVRFALAHELGHAVQHEVEMLPDSNEAERESHTFAGAFLLPAREVLSELPRGRLQLRHLYELKLRWRVAMQAIAMRAADLGAINRKELSRLFRELSYRGYRTSEPGEISIETPMVLSSALEIHRGEHGLSNRELSDFVRVEPETLNDLFPEHFSPSPRPRLQVVGTGFSRDAASEAS